MGQHTWFYKEKSDYNKVQKLYDTLWQAENSEIYLSDNEIKSIENTIDFIEDNNKLKYCNLFRADKREPDNTYCEDVITSKEQCDKWLVDNQEFVSYINQELLDKFWQQYPTGVIDFG